MVQGVAIGGISLMARTGQFYGRLQTKKERKFRPYGLWRLTWGAEQTHKDHAADKRLRIKNL